MYYKIRDFIRGLKNFWIFKREIYTFKWWDYTFIYRLMGKALGEMEKGFNSNRALSCVAPNRAKEIKIARILLKRIEQDEYASPEEKRLWEKVLKRKPLFPLSLTEEERKFLRKEYDRQEQQKKQDLEHFCKLFMKSRGWWD